MLSRINLISSGLNPLAQVVPDLTSSSMCRDVPVATAGIHPEPSQLPSVAVQYALLLLSNHVVTNIPHELLLLELELTLLLMLVDELELELELIDDELLLELELDVLL